LLSSRIERRKHVALATVESGEEVLTKIGAKRTIIVRNLTPILVISTKILKNGKLAYDGQTFSFWYTETI